MNPELELSIQQAIQAFQSENYEGAKSILGSALEIDINSADAIFSLGISYADANKLSEALTIFNCLQSFNVSDPQISYNLGFLYAMQGDFKSAHINFDRAIKLNPNDLDTIVNYDRTIHELKQFNEALRFYEKALKLGFDHEEVFYNKGNTLYELKRYNEAIADFNKALTLNPDIDWVLGALLHTRMKICSWSGMEDLLDILSKKVLGDQKVSQPFWLVALNDAPSLHKKSSEIYVQSKYPFNPLLGPILKRPKTQKIRVGYFSADFHNHATGYLMAELFELHNKSQFELIGLSFGPITNDEMRHRLEKSFDQFIEVGHLSDAEIAQLSRGLNIDIAVDLKGFTQDARTKIFSYRAAPIQVNYLGYPGTMGANYIDYIIADGTLIPAESQAYYSEKVVYLPHSYQVNDRKRVISDRQFTRHELGLPEDGFVFCCFNNNFKILPETFAGWMRILKAVEGSVIWLFKDNPWVAENLRKEAQKHGINPERMVFADRMPLSDHLARHRQADLFLDTLPYNAHTTTSDALWAGLPVLTLKGMSFASRVAASLLTAIELPELITSTQEEYEAAAIELATNSAKHAEIKLKLANNRLTTPLFNTPLFVKNIEAAFIKMYEGYQADSNIDHIYIG